MLFGIRSRLNYLFIFFLLNVINITLIKKSTTDENKYYYPELLFFGESHQLLITIPDLA